MMGNTYRKGLSSWNKDNKGLIVAWNKGLTKETDERIAKAAISEEARLIKSLAVKEWWKLKKQKEYAIGIV
jgi:hypothetical protein